MPGRQHASAEHHGGRLVEQLQPGQRRDREGRDLRRLASYDVRGDAVAVSGDVEEQRCHLHAPLVSQVPQVHRLDQRQHRGEAEVSRQGVGQRRARAASVLGTGRPPHRLGPEEPAPAPVAGDVPDGREAHLLTVASTPGAVDPGPADHRDAVRLVEAGPQQCVGVVEDRARGAPGARLHRLLQEPLLHRQVDVGEAGGDVAHHAGRRADAGVGGRLLDQDVQARHGCLGPDDVRQEAGSASGSEDLAVVGHDRHVRLRVAGVHRQHGRCHAHGR